MMAHFAQLDDDNKVINVIVISNEDILDENNNESEALGIAFCQKFINGTWVQTSYNGDIRGKYAGIGDTYDAVIDAFYSPQPYPSWTLDSDAKWQPPVLCPVEEGKFFTWDEPTLSWVEAVLPTE